LGTRKFKWTPIKKSKPKETLREAMKRLKKEYRPPIPTDELPEYIEKMAPIWRKMADHMGCPYCKRKRRRGEVPRWRAWQCPVCKRRYFLMPKDVKDIDDLM